MTRARMHPDGCDCDQPWHHQPPAGARAQARRDERARRAWARRKGKTIGNAQRHARARHRR